MKGYVVTLMSVAESMEVAMRCKESGEKYGVDVELVPAFPKESIHETIKDSKLTVSKFDESYSNKDAVLSNFMTQYYIWKRIAESGEPGIVLEHDAVFTGPVPELTDDIVNLGKPSYGQYKQMSKPGVYPMFSKTGGYIPGAHGYYLTPNGAQKLVDSAHQHGAAPCDLFLNNRQFPNIKELYPWVIEARDSFSTIQKEKGCLAKHNYDKDYKLL